MSNPKIHSKPVTLTGGTKAVKDKRMQSFFRLSPDTKLPDFLFGFNKGHLCVLSLPKKGAFSITYEKDYNNITNPKGKKPAVRFWASGSATKCGIRYDVVPPSNSTVLSAAVGFVRRMTDGSSSTYQFIAGNLGKHKAAYDKFCKVLVAELSSLGLK